MKNKLLYSLIAGAVVMTGLSSCDNEEFLNVTHYSILEMSTMYESDANAKAALNGCYDLMLPSNTAGHNGDPFKPYLFTGSHPTMDSQAPGWAKAFMECTNHRVVRRMEPGIRRHHTKQRLPVGTGNCRQGV